MTTLTEKDGQRRKKGIEGEEGDRAQRQARERRVEPCDDGGGRQGGASRGGCRRLG